MEGSLELLNFGPYKAVSRTLTSTKQKLIADLQSRLNAASLDPLNPLAPPGWRLEGIREILCLVDDLTVAELHNAYCVRWPPLVGDCVFRDPEVTFSENSLDVETRRLAWMMTPQGLQIASSEDSFA